MDLELWSERSKRGEENQDVAGCIPPRRVAQCGGHGRRERGVLAMRRGGIGLSKMKREVGVTSRGIVSPGKRVEGARSGFVR